MKITTTHIINHEFMNNKKKQFCIIRSKRSPFPKEIHFYFTLKYPT